MAISRDNPPEHITMRANKSESLPPGSRVWVKNDCTWIKATVTAVVDGEAILQADDGTTLSSEIRQCFMRNADSEQVEDMTALAHLHEPGVLWNLAQRYSASDIYTYTGSILLAVNPFARLPGMYDAEAMRRYSSSPDLRQLPPHVFAVAAAAYRTMMRDKKGQALLVTGESGAGKTETSKVIMRFLAHCGGHHQAGESHEVAEVERKVLESNPLLEAFGNAKTVRNDNSSRFGKYVELHFDAAGAITGAAVRTFLLERCRVVGLNDPERNYHVFYQLCEGATAEERARWHLLPAQQFKYLNSSSCFQLPGVDNAEEYQHTRRAMTCIGLTPQEQDQAFQVVAAVLHLGNVVFVGASAEGGQEASAASSDSRHHLEAAAQLLGVDAGELERVLVTRNRNTVDGVIVSPLDPKAASTTRDAMVMALYARLFDWLVAQVNRAVGGDSEPAGQIGLLDIYGFESFAVNDFEQLCINLANEKLQQHFNTHVFKWQQAEYERDGIDWSYIDFADNQDVLDLIEGRLGVLDLIDEQCRFPSATAKELARKLTTSETLLESPRYSVPKRSSSAFAIEHYAGSVTYQVGGLLDKNRDYAVAEHTSLMGGSSVPLVALLMGPSPDSQTGCAANGDAGTPNKGGKPGANGLRNGGSSYQFISVGSQFRQQLGELMAVLQRMEPHYVRCIKPNPASKPLQLDPGYALQQLKCGGVMEAVRISCAAFLDQFWQLVPQHLRASSLPDREKAGELMKAVGLDGYQLGHTKVFLKCGAIASLEGRKLALMTNAASRIQHAWRGYAAARDFRRLRAAAVLLQAALRGCAARRELRFRRETRAATLIQAHFRGWCARLSFEYTRLLTICVQAQWRGQLARRAVRKMRTERAALALQTAWRVKQARRQLLAAKQERAATAIQRCWRGYLAWAMFQLQRMAARIIQRGWRNSLARKRFFRTFLVNCRQHIAASIIQAAWRRNRRSEMLRERVRCAFADFIEKHAAALSMQRAYRFKAAQRKLSKHRLASRVQMWQARLAAAAAHQPSPPAKSPPPRTTAWPKVQPPSQLSRAGSSAPVSHMSRENSCHPASYRPHRHDACTTDDLLEGSARLLMVQGLASNLSEPELSGQPSSSDSPDSSCGWSEAGASQSVPGSFSPSMSRTPSSASSDVHHPSSRAAAAGKPRLPSLRFDRDDDTAPQRDVYSQPHSPVAGKGYSSKPELPEFNIADVRSFWLKKVPSPMQNVARPSPRPSRLSL